MTFNDTYKNVFCLFLFFRGERLRTVPTVGRAVFGILLSGVHCEFNVTVFFRDIPVDFKYIAEPSMHSMPAVTLSPNSESELSQHSWREESCCTRF